MEVSGAVRLIYRSLGVKGLNNFIAVTLMCFTMCTGLDCAPRLLFCCPIWITDL